MYRKDDNDNATVLNYTKKIEGKLIIPEKIGINGKDYNVTAVGYGSFYGCVGLTRVEMPKVETVGDGAFAYCEHLRIVKVPKLETVGDGAFNYCIALTSVEMPKTGCCFKSYSFYNCPWQPSENGVTSSCLE